MADNATIVRDYYDTVWNRGLVEQTGRFVAEDLAQHNPGLPDGRAALVSLIDDLRRRHPDGRVDVRRLAADGDLVFTHSLYTTGPDDRGAVIVDVFRLADGLIVEHWDLRGDVPHGTASGRPVV